MTPNGKTPPRSPAARELEAMWESILAAGWNSLAVVPTDHGTPIELVTNALEAVAARQPKGAFRLIDAQGATVSHGTHLTSEFESAVREGVRVVVIVDSLMRSLAGIPLLRQAEVVLLVVRVGSSDPEGLTSTLGIVGPDRIIGSVAVPYEEQPS